MPSGSAGLRMSRSTGSHDSASATNSGKQDGDRNASAMSKQYDEMRAQLADLVTFKASIDDKAHKEEQQRQFRHELQAGVRAYLAGVNIELPAIDVPSKNK